MQQKPVDLRSRLALYCNIAMATPAKKKDTAAITRQWEVYYEAFQKTDWPKAISALEALSALEPKNSNVFLKKGDSLQKAGRLKDAIMSYHHAALLHMTEGYNQKAIAVYKIILRLDPNDAEAINKSNDLLLAIESSRTTAADLKLQSPIQPDAQFATDESSVQSTPETTASAFFDASDFGMSTACDETEESSAGLQPEPKEDAPITAWGEFGSEPKSDAIQSIAPEDKPTPEEPGFYVPDQSPAPVVNEWSFNVESESAVAHQAPDIKDNVQETETLETLETIDNDPVPYMFSSLSRDEIEQVMIMATRLTYEAGEKVLEEADSGDSLYVIKSGTAMVIAHILGKTLELAELSAGDVFGEVAFLTGRPRTASVVAQGKLTVMEINKASLEDIIHKHPQVLSTIQDFYHSRVQETIKKVKAK